MLFMVISIILSIQYYLYSIIFIIIFIFILFYYYSHHLSLYLTFISIIFIIIQYLSHANLFMINSIPIKILINLSSISLFNYLYLFTSIFIYL